MEEVIVISYLFNIVGQHREIHTEVRAFGFDWWFEKDGAKAQPASSKELDPEWGYTLQRKIREDFIGHTIGIGHIIGTRKILDR